LSYAAAFNVRLGQIGISITRYPFLGLTEQSYTDAWSEHYDPDHEAYPVDPATAPGWTYGAAETCLGVVQPPGSRREEQRVATPNGTDALVEKVLYVSGSQGLTLYDKIVIDSANYIVGRLSEHVVGSEVAFRTGYLVRSLR